MSTFSKGFTVEPANEGSFVVHSGLNQWDRGTMAERHGFSNINDLLTWLKEQAADFKSAEADKIEARVCEREAALQHESDKLRSTCKLTKYIDEPEVAEKIESTGVLIIGDLVGNAPTVTEPVDGLGGTLNRPVKEAAPTDGWRTLNPAVAGSASTSVDHMAAVRESVSRG